MAAWIYGGAVPPGVAQIIAEFDGTPPFKRPAKAG